MDYNFCKVQKINSDFNKFIINNLYELINNNKIKL